MRPARARTTSRCSSSSVAARRGQGQLANVSTIQKINTQGGVVDGACNSDGAFLSVPYAADYAFYRKRD